MGRKVADSLWAVCASRAYVERHGRPRDLAELPRHARVGLDSRLASHRVAPWRAAVAPGVAPLPVALGDAEPDLLRVIDSVPELAREWRLLTTPELRRTPRVSAFFAFVVDEIDALRPILTG